jgi:hypothetical protein
MIKQGVLKHVLKEILNDEQIIEGDITLAEAVHSDMEKALRETGWL